MVLACKEENVIKLSSKTRDQRSLSFLLNAWRWKLDRSSTNESLFFDELSVRVEIASRRRSNAWRSSVDHPVRSQVINYISFSDTQEKNYRNSSFCVLRSNTLFSLTICSQISVYVINYFMNFTFDFLHLQILEIFVSMITYLYHNIQGTK